MECGILRSEREKMESNLNSVSLAFLCAVAIFTVHPFVASIVELAGWLDTCGSGLTVLVAA